MNEKIRRRLTSRKHGIQSRLAEAVKFNGGGPVLDATGIRYELADRVQATTHGGIGAIHRLARNSGLVQQIDRRLRLLKFHAPYHESDHVLNIAYNALCGGRVLEDIELRRNDVAFLNALRAESIPDPTTAGDFCRSDSGLKCTWAGEKKESQLAKRRRRLQSPKRRSPQ